MHRPIVPTDHEQRHANPARMTVNGCCATGGEAIAQQLESECTPPLHTGPVPITLFGEGDVLYQSMLNAIGAARNTIRLETYIVADDEIGRMFADALVATAGDGVDVRLLIDAAGSLFWGSQQLWRCLRDGGVQVKWYHRWSWRHPLRYNQRNHRKLLVVDDSAAYLGGFNIHRENSQAVYGDRRWRDTHIRVEGDLVRQAAAQFDAVWSRERSFTDTDVSDAPAMIVSNIFRNCRHRFRCLYRDRIEAASSRVLLTTPYFVPDRRTLATLLAAARRGLDVRVLVPARSDVRIVRWAARAMYAVMLQAGIRVYEYGPRFLHAKCAAIDSEWSIIGSSNIDYRSFGVNYEICLVAHDRALTSQLTEQFFQDLGEANEVVAEAWSRRRWLNRLFEWFGRALGRWL